MPKSHWWFLADFSARNHGGVKIEIAEDHMISRRFLAEKSYEIGYLLDRLHVGN